LINELLKSKSVKRFRYTITDYDLSMEGSLVNELMCFIDPIDVLACNGMNVKVSIKEQT
jgi:hypothetical protein